MDTKKLVVGQKVWMQSGDHFKEATVTEITEKYVQAEPILSGQNKRPWMIRFQRNGKQFTWEGVTGKVMSSEIMGDFGVYEWYETFGGWWREDPRPLGTKFGPWELVDKPAD